MFMFDFVRKFWAREKPPSEVEVQNVDRQNTTEVGIEMMAISKRPALWVGSCKYNVKKIFPHFWQELS